MNIKISIPFLSWNTTFKFKKKIPFITKLSYVNLFISVFVVTYRKIKLNIHHRQFGTLYWLIYTVATNKMPRQWNVIVWERCIKGSHVSASLQGCNPMLKILSSTSLFLRNLIFSLSLSLPNLVFRDSCCLYFYQFSLVTLCVIKEPWSSTSSLELFSSLFYSQ